VDALIDEKAKHPADYLISEMVSAWNMARNALTRWSTLALEEDPQVGRPFRPLCPTQRAATATARPRFH
jgi:hypothetical protein